MQQYQQSGRGFEEEVRRIANLLWPTPRENGATLRDGRERDAVIVTDDAIHVIEATTLRTKQKAADDIEKTSKLVSQLRRENPDKAVKGWFITRDDLTDDQNDVAMKYKRTVKALCFKDFLSKIVDARAYLSFREKRSFGSVADPITNHFEIPRDNYVQPYFFDSINSNTEKFSSFYEKSVQNGSRTIVLGDFGAGKSMALRELFFRAASDFYRGTTSRFPVYLNLRNHIGQDSPVEALIREAANTGYGRYDDLVKAWRADLVLVILDGFDELLTPAWTQKAHQLREHRAACTRLISEFIRESPSSTPIIVSGRFSYFGSSAEMERALRLTGFYNSYRLNDFTKSQAEELLRKMDAGSTLPDWLPSRPLLLGYLAALSKRIGIDISINSVEPAEGWDYLIDRVCAREVDIQSGLYPEYIRRLLERIGTKSRHSPDLTSPISQQDIASAFREVFGREPDDSNLGMLMRLPGLVAAESHNEERRFIDSDFANICAAGDLYEYICSPTNADLESYDKCRTNIDALGADFIVSKCHRLGRSSTTLNVALDAVAAKASLSCMKGDLIVALSRSDAPARDRWTIVADASLDTLDVRQAPAAFSKLRLDHSIIGTLELDEANIEGIPQFQGCMIDTIRGPKDGEALTNWLNDSTVERFEYESLTNNAILDLPINPNIKVGLTALRKLYLQSGGGRQENAFYRGLKPDLRNIAGKVLNILVSEGYATISSRGSEKIYLKNADKVPEVHAILARKGAGGGALVRALSDA